MDFHSEFRSPRQQANLPFSPALRLLVIALRRQALEGVSTIEELLTGDSNRIRVKEEFLHKPIILAGAPRGLGITENPATSGALTDYIKTRAKEIGMTEAITFYSLRRSAADTVAQTYGLDVARQIMGHDAESATLERSYLDLRRRVDLTAVGLNENHQQREEEMERDLNGNVLFRLPESVTKTIIGPASDALYHKLAAEDDLLLKLDDPAAIKSRKRCLRRVANETARSQVIEEQSYQITNQDLDARKREIVNRMDRFTMGLVERARASMRTQGHCPPGQSTSEDGNDNPDDDLFVRQDAIAEPDADDQPRPAAVTVTEEPNYGEAAAEVPFLDAVRHVLEMLLDHRPDGRPDDVPVHKCHLCANDITASQKLKDRIWPSLAHLTRHQATKYHVGYESWLRRANYVMKVERAPGFACEFYVSCAPAGSPVQFFETIKELEDHVNESSSTGLTGVDYSWAEEPEAIERHDALKEKLGWNGPGFRVSDVVEKRNKNDRARKRKSRGWNSSGIQELEEARHNPDFPGVVMGGPKTPLPAIDRQKGNVLLVPCTKIPKAHEGVETRLYNIQSLTNLSAGLYKPLGTRSTTLSSVPGTI